MADPLSVSSGVLALAAIALESSKVLGQTIASHRNNSRTVHELGEELEALNGVLETLQQMASNTDVDFAILRTPLLRCGQACKDFEAVIVKCTAHSNKSTTSFRDWAKLRYMGDDINEFKNMLSEYKSTLMIALGDANLRCSAITTKVLEDFSDMIANTTVNSEKHLQEIDKKLEALPLRDLALSDEIAEELQQIQDERDYTQQCLSICAQASTQLHKTRSNNFEDIFIAEGGHHIVVSTLEDLIPVERITSRVGSRSLLGHMDDATLAHLVSSNVRDDSSISGLSEQSSVSSVTSLVDSVFSILSGSSKSSVIGPAGAGGRLVALLLNDSHLSSLLQDALKRVSANKFERNFLRILNKFASELRKEAENPQQRSIAKFVRYRARNSAHIVRNSLFSPDKPQEGITPKFEVYHEPINVESDESDIGSGSNHEDDTDLQQLEDFIITSQAFIQLRHKLTSFIYSINEEKIDDKGKHKVVNKIDNKGELEKQELEEQELEEQKPSTNVEKVHTASSASYIEPEVTECQDLPNTGTSSDMSLPRLNNCKPVNEWSSRWHITRFVTHFREFWEPRVHEGKIRIRWKCKCGRFLYDDYIELQRGAAKRLEKLLNQRPGSGGTVHIRRCPTLWTTVAGLVPNIFTIVRRALSIEEQGLPLQHLTPTASVQHLATPHSPLAEALFLLICHNISIYDKKLLQLSVCDIKSDETFFRALKKHYQSKCTRWLSFISLRTLTGIKFVKFEIYRKSQSVDIRLKNDIPPPENPDYRYAPVPIDLIPPVGENRLMHLLENPDCAEDVLACLDRFPKKLREKLACGDKAIASGWGLELEEGVCKKKTAIVYMVCVLVSSIWGILWTVLGHDIQGAFSVSAYMIGITVPLLTLMQHLA